MVDVTVVHLLEMTLWYKLTIGTIILVGIGLAWRALLPPSGKEPKDGKDEADTKLLQIGATLLLTAAAILFIVGAVIPTISN